jgi:hypothetical protein
VRSSYARISTYKMSDTDYSETVPFIAFDDGSCAATHPCWIGRDGRITQ